MNDLKQIVSTGDASKITSLLKNDIGKGSMKEGIIKLISDSELLEATIKSNKRKNQAIVGLSLLLVGLLGYMGYETYKNKKERKSKKLIEDNEKQKVIKEINELSEEEVEEIVEQTLQDEEKIK